MENNSVQTVQQVFCSPGTDNVLCINSDGTLAEQPAVEENVASQLADSGTLDDFLELEEENSSESEVSQLQSVDTAIVFSVGVLALVVVSLLVKKFFK